MILVRYFLKSLAKQFSLFFLLAMLVFTFANLFMRLVTVSSWYVALFMMISMVPLIASFALPFSLIMAVGSVIGNSIKQNEHIPLLFIHRAQQALRKSIILLTGVTACWYAYLLFESAPQSYAYGKEILLQLATAHFNDLAENTVHQPFKNGMFFFRKKTEHSKPFFYSLMIAGTIGAHQRYYVCSAAQGELCNKQLILYNGMSRLFFSSDEHHAIRFKACTISLNSLLSQATPLVTPDNPKFMTLHVLQRKKAHNRFAWFELHKRFSQVLWYILFPLLTMMWLMFFIRQSNFFMITLLFAMFMMMAMYSSFMLAQYFLASSWKTLCCLYLIPLLLVIIFSKIYLSNRRKYLY